MATYSYLKTDIIQTSENSSQEFEDAFPYFVDKSELRLLKDLDDVGLNEYTTITLTKDNPVVSLNDRFYIVRNFNDTTSVSSIKTNLLNLSSQVTIPYPSEFCLLPTLL